MARVTLKQIAERVGLSTFAVSRALSGKDGVSEAARSRIREAADQLGYAPPPQPQPQPQPQVHRDIGVIFHDQDPLNSELQMQMQSGVQREAHRLARPVRLHWTHNPDQMLDFARASSGILLIGPHARETIEAINETGVPVVRLGWVEPLEQVDQVHGTDREAAAAVGQYLIALGHRSIAYLQGMAGLRGRRERLHGLRDAVEAHPHVAVHPMEFEEHGGFAKAFLALRQTGAAPTAFFCAHDGLALTVVSELLALGYRIPDDISVVGFGDFSAATQISPPLTTVRVEGAEMGAVALRLLLDRIATSGGQSSPARRVLIASRIIERRSTGPAPAAGRAKPRRGTAPLASAPAG